MLDSSEPQARFALGRTVATQGAVATIPHHEILRALARHERGDWGDLGGEDIAANNEALLNEGRLLSVYKAADGTRFYVITECDRSYTTVLLPEEY